MVPDVYIKNEDDANETMKRKLDVLDKDDLSAEIRDDSSACTMVPDVYIKNEDDANESMRRKLDVLDKDDLSAEIRDDLAAEITDDSSACTMVPDVYIKNEEDNETLWNSGLVTRHRKCRKIDNTNQELMKVHSYASLNSKLAPRGRTMMSRYCDFQIDQEECYELSI